MVVDDSQIIQDFVEIIVAKSDDIEVVAKVGTGAEALAQLDSIAIDAVTLDLGLPDINGTELLDLIVAKKQIGIIVLSGRTDVIRKNKYSRVAAFDKRDLFDERTQFLYAIRRAAKQNGATHRRRA